MPQAPQIGVIGCLPAYRRHPYVFTKGVVAPAMAAGAGFLTEGVRTLPIQALLAMGLIDQESFDDAAEYFIFVGHLLSKGCGSPLASRASQGKEKEFREKSPEPLLLVVGGRRIELLTSSVSRKRSTSELTTPKMKKTLMMPWSLFFRCLPLKMVAPTGFEPVF